MSMCEQARPAPFRCPTPREVLHSIIGLLPRGRAWQTTEGGPFEGYATAFEPSAFDNGSFLTRSKTSSVLMQFCQAIAGAVHFANARICDLRREFWCATQTETHATWMAEYGLPDACDPFPDLCTKVAAIGGTRCEYYAAIAARAGWSIQCIDEVASCGTRVGSRRSKAGIAKPGRVRAAYLTILVDLNNSPAFTGTRAKRPKAGRLKAGQRLNCGPNLNALECIMARIVHAEIQIQYKVA